MRNEIKNTLAELRSQVADSSLSDGEREELHIALEKLTDSLDDDQVDSSQLAAGIYDRVLDFQQSYPALTKTINQIAEALAHLGI